MRKAFTLVEVLMAMAIFLVGMLAVAAIFPAAALIQKRTIDDVNSEQIERSTKALLGARQFRESTLEATLPAGYDTNGKIVMLPQEPNKVGGWTIRDRAWPSTAPFERATMFWVPIVMDKDASDTTHDWRVFAFVLRGGAREGYPRDGFPQSDWANFEDGQYNIAPPDKEPIYRYAAPGVVRMSVTVPVGSGVPDRFNFDNSNRIVNVADWILDQNGTIYKVIDVDDNGLVVDGFIVAEPALPTEIWLSPATENGSPCQRIVIVLDAVN